MFIGSWQISNFGFPLVFTAKYYFHHHLLKSKKEKLTPVLNLYSFITRVNIRCYIESVLNILVKTHALFIYPKAQMAFIKAEHII